MSHPDEQAGRAPQMVGSNLPTGTVTFLFTDVEGSTRLLNQLGEMAYSAALAQHRSQLRNSMHRHGGVEVDTQGDAFFFAFGDAKEAVAAALEGQAALQGGLIKVRMGLHTGAAILTEEGYVGREIHRAARIAAAGHGEQVLLSDETRRHAKAEAEAVDLGEHRLKDFAERVRIFQLGSKEFPPLKTIANTNLRRPASSFVGRTDELKAVLDLLRAGVRLLTLTGPGGSGKSRLAIEAAAALLPTRRDGVFWVGLVAVRDPKLVQETISRSLGANEDLSEHIGGRELLLVLDNFEQVIEAAPEVASLVESCPRLAVVVTSRELLRVRGEVEYRVPPLAEREAVDLFCARAQVPPDTTISELCRRLDNLPLAVELAAAGMAVLSAEQILDKLGQRLDFLKGGRDAETRQRTLRATIGWSYDLLEADEKALFARLAVFADTWSLSGAEAVCQARLETMQALIDKNLIRRTRDRFSMLESIREYATERLNETGQSDELLALLADYLIRTAKADGSPMFLGHQQDAFALFDQEYANTHAVMTWALAEGRYEFAFELIASLFIFWTARGHVTQALAWAESALAAEREIQEDLRTRMLLGASEIYYVAGNSAMTIRLKNELLERYTAREPADPVALPAILVNLSELARQAGDLHRARELAQRSLELRVARGLNPARALTALAELALTENDLSEAEQLLEKAAQGYLVLKDENNAAATVLSLGLVALRRGDERAAATCFANALQSAEALGNKRVASACLEDLAKLARRNGDLDRAARLWGAARQLRRRGGLMPNVDNEMAGLPETLQAQGAEMNLNEAVAFALGRAGPGNIA